jgi:hypothetical protein
MNKSRVGRSPRPLTVIGIVVCAALGLGAGSAAAAGLTSLVVTDSRGERAERPAPSYEHNARGQSFGSAAEARTPDEEPDLILVVATNGREGYAYRTDLEAAHGPVNPTSPEDALRWQRENAGVVRTVPVYESDGLTRVGAFTIGQE